MLVRIISVLLGGFVVMTLSQDDERVNSQCPSRCKCAPSKQIMSAVNNASALRTIDCSRLDLTSMPHAPRTAAADQEELVDADAESFLASDNRFTHVDLAFLRRYPNLRLFSARNGSIRSLTKSTRNYQPLFNLVHVDLSVNHLHVIHPYVFAGFPSLRDGIHQYFYNFSIFFLSFFSKLLLNCF
jgi:hypothetical protein